MLIEEGTPIEGTAAGPMLSGVESSFVAGEIDVPTPPSLARERDHDTPAVEFIAASSILGQPSRSIPTPARARRRSRRR